MKNNKINVNCPTCKSSFDISEQIRVKTTFRVNCFCPHCGDIFDRFSAKTSRSNSSVVGRLFYSSKQKAYMIDGISHGVEALFLIDEKTLKIL